MGSHVDRAKGAKVTYVTIQLLKRIFWKSSRQSCTITNVNARVVSVALLWGASLQWTVTSDSSAYMLMQHENQSSKCTEASQKTYMVRAGKVVVLLAALANATPHSCWHTLARIDPHRNISYHVLTNKMTCLVNDMLIDEVTYNLRQQCHSCAWTHN